MSQNAVNKLEPYHMSSLPSSIIFSSLQHPANNLNKITKLCQNPNKYNSIKITNLTYYKLKFHFFYVNFPTPPRSEKVSAIVPSLLHQDFKVSIDSSNQLPPLCNHKLCFL
ncbi:unnamed protein product [Lathyrus sativus]|nr:unnamed protein product [Lathyrus sativus]